jgi:phosphate-selective porin OprO/OprP
VNFFARNGPARLPAIQHSKAGTVKHPGSSPVKKHITVRFSTVDLNDEDVEGGTQKNLAFAINWYSKTHWRFMANVIKVEADDGPYGEQKPWIVQLRAQYYF